MKQLAVHINRRPHFVPAMSCLAFAWLVTTTVTAEEPPLKLITAGYIGTAQVDDLQGAAEARDGTIYTVGNVGAPLQPKTVENISVFGQDLAQPKCGRGFVAHWSADMSRLLHYAEFAAGTVILTTVQVNAHGVYVSGYASAGLEPLIADKRGLLPQYSLKKEVALIESGEILASNGLADKDPLAGRPGLGRYGAPFVVRLSTDLKTIDAGTYLEGWQQVWDKNRVKSIRPHETFPTDYFWQPTSTALLKSGDVVVCHDGGYFRLLTAEDRRLVGDNTELLKRLAFYDCCDWLSRLSPDLSRRQWRQPIYTPAVNVEVAKELKAGWSLAHYSNPRTTRMRLDSEENILLCGWSASFTAKEPWWSPYLWKLSATEGKLLWKAYEYDPMSGNDHRMLGTVADTALASFACDYDDNIVTALYADGGNSVIGWSPRAELGLKFEGRVQNQSQGIKLVHWWGAVQRLDGKSREGLGGATFASRMKNGPAGPGFPVDLANLPGCQTLVVGRCNLEFPWTENAWHKGDPEENPTAFLRVYGPDFRLLFSTALSGVIPFEIVPLSRNRYLIVGQARHDTAPTQGTMASQFHGQSDGYYMLVEANPTPAAGIKPQ